MSDQKAYPPPYPDNQGGMPYPQGQQQQYGQPQPYPPPGQGYAPQTYNPQGYNPHMQGGPTTVVHVSSPHQQHQPGHTTIIVQRTEVNHCLHCCISLFFPPWVFVWIFLCATN